MLHVFVETNWVVAYAASAHSRLRAPAASKLLERAAHGDLTLHLPSVCLAEARRPLHQDSQVRTIADRVRQFLSWAKDRQRVTPEEDEVTRRVMDKMESLIRTDLDRLENTLQGLRHQAGIEVFDISSEMAHRCTELSFSGLELKPFDQMILAAVLVRAEELLRSGYKDLAFCELDADLKPWDSQRNPKSVLKSLYDKAQIWVYGDFLLQAPVKPEDWPNVQY